MTGDQKDPKNQSGQGDLNDLEAKIKEAEKADQEKKQESLNDLDAAHQEKIDQLTKELEQMTEMAKKTMADFQNFKRRQEDDRSNFAFLANLGLIKALLPALDNFERALKHIPNENDEWTKGILISIEQFRTPLIQAGLQAVESLGKPFDPGFHEAVTMGPGEKDIVLEEFEKGYTLGKNVIRHAKVKVGNGEKE